MIGTIISAFLGLVVGVVGNFMNAESTEQTNQANKDIAAQTNQTNLEIAEKTNAANVEQANLAYLRSLPVNQVMQMQQAGMSKAAALSKLAGGGTYQAPVLQSATMQGATMQPKHFDFGQIASSLERIGDIPQNIEQEKLKQEELNVMKQQMYLNECEEKRKQELHNLEMDKLLFEKEERDNLYEFISQLDSAAHSKKLYPSRGDSFESYIDKLGLSDSPAYQKLSFAARNIAFQRFRDSLRDIYDYRSDSRAEYADKRAANADKRAATAAADAHKISVQQLSDMKARAKDYEAEKDARQKEYKLREVRADVERLLAEDELTIEQYRHDLEITEDGEIKFSRKVSEKARRAWTRVADTVGVGVLRDLLSAIKLAG